MKFPALDNHSGSASPRISSRRGTPTASRERRPCGIVRDRQAHLQNRSCLEDQAAWKSASGRRRPHLTVVLEGLVIHQVYFPAVRPITPSIRKFTCATSLA